MPVRIGLRILCAGLVWTLGLSLAQPVAAKCSALPVLTGTIDIIDDIEDSPVLTPDQLAELAELLRPLPAELSSKELDQRLESFGLGRRSNAPQQLATKVAALAVIAESGEMDAIKSFVGAKEFQESLYRARDLANEICGPEAEGGWSEYAEMIIVLTGYGGLGAVERDPAEVARDLGAIFLLLVGIGGVAWYRIWKADKEKRANKRSACLIPVHVHDGDQVHALELVDISQAGTNIHNELEWPIEHRIIIEIDDLMKHATVRWSNAHYAGVLFDEQIEREHFELLLIRYPPPPEPDEDEEEDPETKRGPETGAAQTIS